MFINLSQFLKKGWHSSKHIYVLLWREIHKFRILKESFMATTRITYSYALHSKISMAKVCKIPNITTPVINISSVKIKEKRVFAHFLHKSLVLIELLRAKQRSITININIQAPRTPPLGFYFHNGNTQSCRVATTPGIAGGA